MKWNEQEWRDVEQQWRADGFLSEAADKAESSITSSHAAWFTLAGRLNNVGQAAFLEGSVRIGGLGTHDPLPVATRLTLRALSTFQGAVLLSRRGMATEAFTLARNLYEIAFWLGYFASDPGGAAEAFIDDEKASRLSALKLDRECEKLGILELSKADLDRIGREIDGAGKIAKVDTKTIATRGHLLDHYRVYKMLSMKHAHASIGSLFALLDQAPDGTVRGHLIGPDEALAGEALQCASIAFGICIAMFSGLVDGTTQDAALQELLLLTDNLRKAVE